MGRGSFDSHGGTIGHSSKTKVTRETFASGGVGGHCLSEWNAGAKLRGDD